MNFLDKSLRSFLKNDHDYILKVNSPHEDYTTLWGIKRILKKTLNKITFFEKIEWLIYFKYHKFRPKHWLMLFINFYIKKEINISFQSGFGDMLMCFPYFKKASEKYPNHKINAVIHDPNNCRYKEMSYCKQALVEDNGKKVDYVYEFLLNNSDINEIIYDDCWGDGYLYGFPKLLEHEFGFCFDKESFLKNLDNIYNKKDKNNISNYLQQNSLKNFVSVAVHFRTSAESISNLIENIASDISLKDINLKFVLFGAIPDKVKKLLINKNIEYCDISNSYSHGINTRQLIGIVSNCSLFIGGRGGFNAIYYLLDVPTVNIFDQQGRQEISSGMWKKNLWEDNIFQRVYFEDEESSILIQDIKNYLKNIYKSEE